MKKDVQNIDNGVKIQFTGVVQKQQIMKIVENCSTGKCDCMSDETKEKVKDMKVSGEDGDVSLHLSGEIDASEIEVALAKSKVV